MSEQILSRFVHDGRIVTMPAKRAKRLLVLDHVREIAPDRTVQVYRHIDSPAVTWDEARRVATTHQPLPTGTPGPVGRPDINVAIFASPNVRGSLLDGRVSDCLDVARPSTRLLLEDGETGFDVLKRRGNGERATVAASLDEPNDFPGFDAPTLTETSAAAPRSATTAMRP